MATWIDALSRTRKSIAGAITKIFSRPKLDQESIEELETVLLQADVPLKLVMEVVQDLEKSYKGQEAAPREVLRQMLVRSFGTVQPFHWQPAHKPHVVLTVGINGSGKTTSCAKLAHLAKRAGLKPLLGATDTFRAAGSDQLRIWADRVGCEVVAGETGADAAAVAFDAVTAAQSRGLDVLVIDTAGRMHTKAPLMQELQKVNRAIAKKMPGAPHETWIVLDASMGQNAINQARSFHEAVPLTGVVVSKLDGSAKAGFIFSITRDLGVPVRFVGLGEAMDDLAPFDPESFVSALLGFESPYKDGNHAARG